MLSTGGLLRPLGAMRLEIVGRQLEAWDTLLESSWRRLEGQLLEAYWKLQSQLWRALGGVLEAPGAILEALGEPWGCLGHSGHHPGGLLEAHGGVLEASKRRLGVSMGRLGAVMEAKRPPQGPGSRPLERAIIKDKRLITRPTRRGRNLNMPNYGLYRRRSLWIKGH